MDLNIKQLRLAAKQYLRKCPRTLERLLALTELAKRASSKGSLTQLDYERVAIKFGTSSRTLRRWKRSWVMNGIKALVPKVSTGRKKRPISGFNAKKILEYRKKYNWGAEVIQAHLKIDFGQIISQDRIHRYLLSKGLVDSKKKKKLKNRHTKVVKVKEPGAHTQNDVKHLPHLLGNGQKCYVYNFVDHASKSEFKRAYLSYGPSETKDFILRVLKEMPFQIKRLQTDNGIEFTNKFITTVDKPRKHALDKVCDQNNIKHVLIPVGEKELQGLVERNHRMDDEELYHRIRPHDINQFNRYLEAHYKWRNSSRRRKSLEWKTPNEWLKSYDKNILSGFVRHKDPVDSVDILPNEKLTPNEGWERGLVEVWSHLAHKTNTEAAKCGGLDKPRQNIFEATKQTEVEAHSVREGKKAA